MQHDVQLRAAARDEYQERGRLWRQLPFEEAERCRTSGYLEAVETVLGQAAEVRDYVARVDQLALL